MKFAYFFFCVNRIKIKVSISHTFFLMFRFFLPLILIFFQDLVQRFKQTFRFRQDTFHVENFRVFETADLPPYVSLRNVQRIFKITICLINFVLLILGEQTIRAGWTKILIKLILKLPGPKEPYRVYKP